MVFFNFSKFFGIFFYASGRNETKRNDNFYFPYFSSFSDLFWLEMNHNRISFFFFFEFFTIFMEFSITHRVGTEQNGTIIFISLFLIFFQPILAWNEFLMVFFNFFCYFFWIFYYASGRNETEQQFLFSIFLSLFQPILAWNEAVMVFFEFFGYVFLEFSITHWVGTERNGTIIFILSLSQPFQSYFGLKWSHNDIFLIFLIFLSFFYNFLSRLG